jgi:hypothetical protein
MLKTKQTNSSKYCKMRQYQHFENSHQIFFKMLVLTLLKEIKHVITTYVIPEK